MRSYSIDLRERVVAACDRGEGTREQIAKRFCVSVAWVYKLLARRRETGSIAPRPHGGGQPPALPRDSAERLRKAGADRPDATPAALRAAPREGGGGAPGAAGGTGGVSGARGGRGLPRKKSPSGPPSRTARS